MGRHPETALEKDPLHPIPTVLVVVPDPELRRSVEFALEAEGYGVVSHALLASALDAVGAAVAACVIVDENAIANRNGAGSGLEGIAGAVILLVDRLRTVPDATGIRVLTKPLLGRRLVETVAEIMADGGTGARAR